MKKLTFIAVLLAICFVFCACESLIEPIDYSQNGLKITLDTSYKRVDPIQTENWYTAWYQSSFATVYMLRESFDDIAEATTLDEYAALVLAKNGLQLDVKEGSYYSFVNEVVADNIRLTSFVALYKMSDCFWTVQFICNSEHYKALSVDFERFADSVQDVKANT